MRADVHYNRRMTEVNDLLQLCDEWSRPLGPFGNVDDVRRAMVEFGERLGSLSVPLLVDWVVANGRKTFDHPVALEEFLDTYGRLYPTFEVALLDRLGPSGPPLLVGLLGASRAPGVARRLIEIVDLRNADSELQIAFFGALAELQDPSSEQFLMEINGDALPHEVRHELETARRNVMRVTSQAEARRK